jgi:hypothetical protein
MKAESHLARGNEIRSSINSLEKNKENVSAIVELVYGCAFHYIAFASEKKFGTHLDIHNGLMRFLRERDEDKTADLFSDLETIRHGRWYGGKGNGDTIKKVLKILRIIEGWKDEY